MAPPIYKAATPALKEKLQHYRDDPEARAELHQRVKQHHTAAKVSTPHEHDTAAAAAAAAAGTGPASTAPLSPNPAKKSSSPKSPAAKIARNFIEENAALISPWPCTGPLSSRALAAAQQQPPPWESLDRLGSSDSVEQLLKVVPASNRPCTAPATAGTSSSTSSSRHPRTDLSLNLVSIHSCSTSHSATRPQTASPTSKSSSSPCWSPPTQAVSPTRLATNTLAAAAANDAGSNSSSRCSSSCSMSRSCSRRALLAAGAVEGVAPPAASCVELLAAQLAAKKEAAATRAASAADRRAALAAAEQQRREVTAGRSQRLQTERVTTQQAEITAAALHERQQVWAGIVAATQATSQLAAALQQRQQQAAAARFIATCYKSCLMRRRQRELASLVTRLRQLLQPYIEAQRAAAHARCARRLLSFLQVSTSTCAVVFAAHRFKHNVVIIQRWWRRVRMMRAAQEALLIQAMKKLEQQITTRNRAAATAAAAAAAAAAATAGGNRPGSRPGRNHVAAATAALGSSCNGSSSGSGSSASGGSGGQVGQVSRDVVLQNWTDRSTSRSGSGSSSNNGSSLPAAVAAHAPIVRSGGPLIRPHEFFLDEPAPAEEPSHKNSSNRAAPADVPAAAAALPRGPMPARGVYMTGQLTAHAPIPDLLVEHKPHDSSSSSSSNNQEPPVGSSTSRSSRPGSAAVAGQAPHSPQHRPGNPSKLSPNNSKPSMKPCNSVKPSVSFKASSSLKANSSFSAHSCSTTASTSSSRSSPVTQRPASAAPAAAGSTALRTTAAAAAAGSSGSSVRVVDEACDLEVEARLRDLLDPLPADVRRKVVRAHLSAARRQLCIDREAHAAALVHYQKRLQLEQLKQQLLREAGVDAPISLQAPQCPHMRVLLPKPQLKGLIVQGMELLLRQLLEERLQADDAAGAAQPRFGSCSGRCND